MDQGEKPSGYHCIGVQPTPARPFAGYQHEAEIDRSQHFCAKDATAEAGQD
jgi:hypothetical protein